VQSAGREEEARILLYFRCLSIFLPFSDDVVFSPSFPFSPMCIRQQVFLHGQNKKTIWKQSTQNVVVGDLYILEFLPLPCFFPLAPRGMMRLSLCVLHQSQNVFCVKSLWYNTRKQKKKTKQIPLKLELFGFFIVLNPWFYSFCYRFNCFFFNAMMFDSILFFIKNK
jgi:hypothetical protein